MVFKRGGSRPAKDFEEFPSGKRPGRRITPNDLGKNPNDPQEAHTQDETLRGVDFNEKVIAIGKTAAASASAGDELVPIHEREEPHEYRGFGD